MSWIQNDELFFKELATGNKWANHVADFLNNNEIKCHSPKMEIRADISDIARFSLNDKDILFEQMSGHLEVKSRNLRFNSDVETYPYDTAFVDTLNGWNQKAEKPLAVVLVSQKTGEMLVCPVSTEQYWGQVTKYDSVRGIWETWLTIEKKYLQPVTNLLQWLKERQALVVTIS